MRKIHPILASGWNVGLVPVRFLIISLMAVAVEQPALAAPAWGDQGDGTYVNPVLWADFNNPCVFRQGNMYYLTAATHHFMGAPVLASSDLVNWRYVGKIYEDLSALSPDFDHPGLAYSSGSQDGEVVEHDGKLYYYNWSTRYRGFMAVAAKPEGPWGALRRIRENVGGEYEDPCPFWDEDGQGYLALVGNPGPLKLFRLNQTCDGIEGAGVVLIQDIAPKGPQIFKREGFYYISVAQTGPEKAQFIYRSRSLFGPYEGRKIFSGKGQGMQAAQGSLVPVLGDQWAFIHHEYDMNSPYGRRLFLQPAGWRDGWPWIGDDPDGDGVGQPVGLVGPVRKPSLPAMGIGLAEEADEFSEPRLGAQWMWNHDPDAAAWSLRVRPGFLRLVANSLSTAGGRSQYPSVAVNFYEDHLLFAKNTLVQRLVGRKGIVETCLDFDGLKDGHRAGLCTLSRGYVWIGVVQDKGVRRVICRRGELDGPLEATLGPELAGSRVWLRLEHDDARGTLSFSDDGEHFAALGEPCYQFRSFWYEGTKVGLFAMTSRPAPEAGMRTLIFFARPMMVPAASICRSERHGDGGRSVFFGSGYAPNQGVMDLALMGEA